MPTTYSTGNADDYDDLVDQIEIAADAAGWTTAIGDTPGATGADIGRTLTLDQGNDFIVTIRSVADLIDVTMPAEWSPGQGPIISGPGVMISAEYEGGSLASAPPILPVVDNAISATKYIGPQPFSADWGFQDDTAPFWVDSVFPAPWHIFTGDQGIVVVVQTGAAYFQWMIFGELVKFGDWIGGGYYGASGVARSTNSAASAQKPSHSNTATSSNRSFAPFHRMQASFNAADHASQNSNTHVHCITGTAEDDIDDFHWTYNMANEPGTLGGGTRLVREAVANVWWAPMPARSPNTHNEVSVMVPYWLATQRESHRCIIGRVPHIRHIPIDNFNAGDTFELGSDEWMVFPYFEREGLTGLHGWAIRRSGGT